MFISQSQIYYDQTDATGVMYHARYLDLFERARSDWLRSLGLHQEKLRQESNIAFTIPELTIQYYRPARLDDQIEIQTTLVTVTGARFAFMQNMAINELVLARLRTEVACVNLLNFKPTRLPKTWYEILKKLI